MQAKSPVTQKYLRLLCQACIWSCSTLGVTCWFRLQPYRWAFENNGRCYANNLQTLSWYQHKQTCSFQMHTLKVHLFTKYLNIYIRFFWTAVQSLILFKQFYGGHLRNLYSDSSVHAFYPFKDTQSAWGVGFDLICARGVFMWKVPHSSNSIILPFSTSQLLTFPSSALCPALLPSGTLTHRETLSATFYICQLWKKKKKMHFIASLDFCCSSPETHVVIQTYTQNSSICSFNLLIL